MSDEPFSGYKFWGLECLCKGLEEIVNRLLQNKSCYRDIEFVQSSVMTSEARIVTIRNVEIVSDQLSWRSSK